MAKYEKNGEVSYALGTTLALELLMRKPKAATRLYISPKQKKDDTYQKLLSIARSLPIPVIENNEKIFRELSDKENCMVIAEFSKFETPLEKETNHVLLVNPSNMGNLGTIIRCCAAFGVLDLGIILPAADRFDPKCIRASMGAIFNVRTQAFSSFEEYQAAYANHACYPFMLQAKTKLGDAHPASPWTLIFGNEATGLDASYLSVGEPLIIPKTDLVDSLNLDNAVAIGIYEFAKNLL